MQRRDSGPTGSLFERIREAANPPSYQNPKEALIRSIRRNLRQVLNTRSGSCYGSPELGITDLNDESLASSDFRREIRSPLASAFYITNLVLPMLLLRLRHRMNTPLWNCVFILWLRSMSARPRECLNLTFCWTTINAIVWSDLCGF